MFIAHWLLLNCHRLMLIAHWLLLNSNWLMFTAHCLLINNWLMLSAYCLLLNSNWLMLTMELLYSVKQMNNENNRYTKVSINSRTANTLEGLHYPSVSGTQLVDMWLSFVEFRLVSDLKRHCKLSNIVQGICTR